MTIISTTGGTPLPSPIPAHAPTAAPPRKPRRQRRLLKARRLRRGYKPRLRGVPHFLVNDRADTLLAELAQHLHIVPCDSTDHVALAGAVPSMLFDVICEYAAGIEDYEDTCDAEEPCEDEGCTDTDDEDDDPAEDNGDREPQCEDEGAQCEGEGEQCDDEGAIETDLGADDHGEASLVSAENASLSTYAGAYDLEASLVPVEAVPC